MKETQWNVSVFPFGKKIKHKFYIRINLQLTWVILKMLSNRNLSTESDKMRKEDWSNQLKFSSEAHLKADGWELSLPRWWHGWGLAISSAGLMSSGSESETFPVGS